jgi:hypothetical protein
MVIKEDDDTAGFVNVLCSFIFCSSCLGFVVREGRDTHAEDTTEKEILQPKKKYYSACPTTIQTLPPYGKGLQVGNQLGPGVSTWSYLTLS